MIPQPIESLPPVSIAETLSGAPGIIDLWYLPACEALDEQTTQEYESLLTPEEIARHRRFRFQRDRDLFLATRALVRTTLSRYAAVDPCDWRFEAGENGKPFVSDPAVSPALHFNLSNTPGLVVCAVSVAHAAVGVDTERLDRKARVAIAERYFAPRETALLRALPAEEQSRYFLEIWTLKESYIKARASGLALALDSFAFRVEDQSITIDVEPRAADDAARWRFALLTLQSRFLIALSVDAATDLSLRAVMPAPGS